jgi:poly-beta-1,6-N-acetyl-D-glucosamine synthase
MRVVEAGDEAPSPPGTLSSRTEQDSAAPVVRLYTNAGVQVVRMEGAGSHPSVPLPRALDFVAILLLLFGLAAVVALAFYAALFGPYDHLVAIAGTILYWPLNWPGVFAVSNTSLLVPDYIFPMYIAGMFALLLATGLATSSVRFTRRRRLLAVGVIVVYFLVELILDSLLFTFPGTTFRNFGLLARGLTGGLFFALLTFCAVYLPAPAAIKARFPRDRGAIVTFLVLGVSAILLAVGVIFLALELLRTTNILVAFTLLLLLPVLTLPIFSLMGRTLYFRRIKSNPPPPLSVYHPSVSILIPGYNEEEWIEDSILSCDRAAAHYPGAVEIIMGNDGSTDRTLEIARGAIARLQHSTGVVVDLPHGGKSNALNGALAVARNEIVIRVDGDTSLSEEPGFAAIVGHFADPQVGGVQGAIHPRQTNGWTRKLRALEIAWMHYMLRPANMGTRSAEVIDGLFSAFRREDLVELGGWVPWNGEDTEISIRMQRLGYKIRIEFGALAFEDVPGNYTSLRRQRVRWARGVMMANGQHYNSLLGPTPEFAGLAVLFWLILLIRSGLRSLVYVYLALLVLVLQVPAILDTAILLAIAICIRAVPLIYFLVRMRRYDAIPWVVLFPFFNIMKQTFRFEAIGTFGPNAAQEYI